MSILDRLIGYLAPHTCLGCSREGKLLCVDCSDGLPRVPERCYRCRKRSLVGRTCLSCRRSSNLRAVRVATMYDSTAKALVWKLKFSGAQAAATEISALLTKLIMGEDELEAHILPVPTTSRRVRQRGYDQTKLLGRALASRTNIQYLNCLHRSGQAHQVGASRRQRLSQLEDAFRTNQSLGGMHIILVDDVVTTGATLEAAAKACRAAGAVRVEAVVFAQA
jgi:ComF family protein